MRRWLVVLVGCTSGGPAADDASSLVSEADADTDVDADTDTDTNEPSVCPFAGSYAIEAVACVGVPYETSGAASISGSAEACAVRFEGITHSGCEIVEQLELFARPFGLWEVYSDGAPGSDGCLAFPGHPRGLGTLRAQVLDDGSLELLHEGLGDGVALKIADPCSSELRLVLAPED